MSGVSLVFLHFHYCPLDIVVDFLRVFISPYLSLANLFLCVATRATLSHRPDDDDDDDGDNWYLLNTYCGPASLFLCAYMHFLIKSM